MPDGKPNPLVKADAGGQVVTNEQMQSLVQNINNLATRSLASEHIIKERFLELDT